MKHIQIRHKYLLKTGSAYWLYITAFVMEDAAILEIYCNFIPGNYPEVKFMHAIPRAKPSGKLHIITARRCL